MTVLQNKIAERAKRLLCFIDPLAFYFTGEDLPSSLLPQILYQN